MDKTMYKKIFGNDISDRFVISESRIEHISNYHPKILFIDIVYCINNPNFVTKTEDDDLVNIIFL